MIYNKDMETMSREELEKLTFLRLKETLIRVYYTIPFYQRRFDEVGVHPDDFKRIEDIRKFPFLTKDDLRDNYPFGLFGVPLKKIVRIHSSSGTTGKPTVVGYTREDIELWAELMARTLAAAGTTEDDIVHIAYGYGLFTGGLGVHYGAEKIGATVIPISGGNTKRQIMVMEDFGSTILACTPSYAILLGDYVEEMGKKDKLKLKAGVFGAEPWSESMRKSIEEKLNLSAYDIYGLSEVIGPGVSYECSAKDGLHIAEDHFYPEIIDPETGEVLPPGEEGELVITSLTKIGFPIIRYRTRDITSLNYEPCKCGRTHVRMKKVFGRTDDMLIIRGVNVFPSQIEHVLMDIEGVAPHYQIVVYKEGPLDVLEVWVEVDERFFKDKMSELSAFEQKVKAEIESTLNISVRVKLVEPKTLQRFEGKAKRVIDKRKEQQ
jgi:phenylacetate-CoA ligase